MNISAVLVSSTVLLLTALGAHGQTLPPVEITGVYGCSVPASATELVDIEGSAYIDGCQTEGGDVLTFTGVNLPDPETHCGFGECNPVVVRVTIGLSECVSPALNATTQLLTCTVPEGAGMKRPINVKISVETPNVQGGQTLSDVLFEQKAGDLTFAPPSIASVSGCAVAGAAGTGATEECARGGGVLVTVEGANFGAADAAILIDGEACLDVQHAAGAEAHAKVTCTLPGGVGDARPVLVIAGNQPGAAVNKLSYVPCPAGTETDFAEKRCVTCSPGRVAHAGARECETCLAGKFAVRGAEDLFGGVNCEPCPREGVRCVDGLATVEDGFWIPPTSVISSEDDEVWECLNEEACVSNATSSAVACNKTLGYTGVLCGECLRTHTRQGKKCTECDSGTFDLWVVVLVGVALWLGLIQLSANTSGEDIDTGAALWRIFISYYTVTASLGEFHVRGPALFHRFMSQFTKASDSVNQAVLPVVCVSLRSVATEAHLVDDDEEEDGGSFYLAVFLFKVILPYLVILAVGVGLPCHHAFLKWWHRGDETYLFNFWDRVIASTVWVVYFLFPTIVTDLFKVFQCTEPIGDEGARFLKSDLSVRCYADGRHTTSAVVAGALLLVYNIGLPIAIRAITTGKAKDKLDWTALETVHMHKKESAKSKALRAQLVHEAKKWKMKFGFLYRGLARGREWWEIVVLARKTAIAAVLVFVEDTFLQSLLAIFVLLIAAFLQAGLSPYQENVLNRVELFALMAALFTQLFSVFYFWVESQMRGISHDDDKMWRYETAITVGLFAMNVDAIASQFLYLYFASREKINKVFHVIKKTVRHSIVFNVLKMRPDRKDDEGPRGVDNEDAEAIDVYARLLRQFHKSREDRDVADAVLKLAKTHPTEYKLLDSLWGRKERLERRDQSRDVGMPLPGVEIFLLLRRWKVWRARKARQAAGEDPFAGDDAASAAFDGGGGGGEGVQRKTDTVDLINNLSKLKALPSHMRKRKGRRRKKHGKGKKHGKHKHRHGKKGSQVSVMPADDDDESGATGATAADTGSVAKQELRRVKSAVVRPSTVEKDRHGVLRLSNAPPPGSPRAHGSGHGSGHGTPKRSSRTKPGGGPASPGPRSSGAAVHAASSFHMRPSQVAHEAGRIKREAAAEAAERDLALYEDHERQQHDMEAHVQAVKAQRKKHLSSRSSHKSSGSDLQIL